MLTEADIRAALPNLRNYAYVLTRRGTGADDLIQDTLTRAWSRRAHYCGGDARAWLFTIMHNEHVNHVRHVARHGKTVQWSEHALGLSSAPRQLDHLEVREIARGMKFLTEGQQTAVLLAGLTQADNNEIARVCDVPIGTVRSRLSRGRQTLRKLTEAGPPRSPFRGAHEFTPASTERRGS